MVYMFLARFAHIYIPILDLCPGRDACLLQCSCFTLLRNHDHLLSVFLKKSPLLPRSQKAHLGDGVSQRSHTFCPSERIKEVRFSPISCYNVT